MSEAASHGRDHAVSLFTLRQPASAITLLAAMAGALGFTALDRRGGSVAASPRESSGSLRPVTLSSTAGRLEVVLDVDYDTFTIGKDRVRLRAYNGRLVGPVLRVKAGDTLVVILDNRLPLNPPLPRTANGQYEWNTTNLHFHGLHVTPQGSRNLSGEKSDAEGDNMLLEVPPSSWPGRPFDPRVSRQRYELRIPADHPAGTFWYHASKHGAVAAQVSSGLVGALIVERDDDVTNLDSLPAVCAAAEEIVLLQQIPYMSHVFDDIGGIEPLSPGALSDLFGPGAWSKRGRYTLVNGERIPTITMAPGEIRRLRVIHGGAREKIALTVVPAATTMPATSPTMYEVALDGFATGRLDRTACVELYPGCRSDVLLHAPRASGEYVLMDASRPESSAIGTDGSPEPVSWIARLVIAGAPKSMSLPTEAELLGQRLADPDPRSVTATRYLFYGLESSTHGRPSPSVAASEGSFADAVAGKNGVYGTALPRVVNLGSTERWIIGARGAAATPSRDDCSHVFHLPVNPFAVTRIFREEGGQLIDTHDARLRRPIWRDTLPLRDGHAYEILVQFRDFVGAFPNHCQVLDHADDGMMELMTVVDAKYDGRVDADGLRWNHISATIPPSGDRPSVLFFVKGAACVHCMAQLTEMAAGLTDRDLTVSVISASTLEDLQRFPPVPFHLVADPSHVLFRAYGAFNNVPLHATLVFDPRGAEVFRDVGAEPLRDLGRVLTALEVAAKRADRAESRAAASPGR